MGNLGTLALGALLIIGVLFMGYKMDTSSQKSYTTKSSKKKKNDSPFREEYIEDEEEDIYPSKISSNSFEDDYDKKYDDNKYFENDYTENYDDDYSQAYEVDEVSQSDLVEDSVYEDEDISFFNDNENIASTFNDDIDNNIAFETEEDVAPEEFVQEKMQEVEDIVEPEPEVVPVVEEVEPVKPKRGRGRPKKVKEPEVVEEPKVEDDFSSTMIFDTEKLYGTLDELDGMDKKTENVTPVEEQEDYSAPVYDIDEKIDALDDDDIKPVYDGPVQPDPDDAESFMNQLKRMQESAEADEFSGFVVDNKDNDLKEAHKRYTKKKLDPLADVAPISFIPEIEEPEEIIPTQSDVDMNFLEQMEKNLKATQKERLSKKKKNEDK